MKTYFDYNDHFTTTLSQEGRSVTLNGPDCGGYYPQIAGDLQAGMAITISMWGSDYGEMSWLDGDTGCQGGCYNNPTVYIKNLQVNTGGNSARLEELDEIDLESLTEDELAYLLADEDMFIN